MTSRICNRNTIYHTHTEEESRERLKKALALGYEFDRNFRAYIPWKPNVKGMRYEKGRLVPRHAAFAR